ncbi:putative synaptobrevin-like protein [Neospora caninum Liverpool]|uniref:Putative synaptobrevin-like protein n=1 Tax=Neospora caninum (strain Liverpool) TaxID=572307 RepID=F0VHH6_NEOCL|nr:putative synaptobrevin-like protein [Neospora caninum Liverpool]CBZ53170.1 putative synaptobrevin-like protein [Neospora caninum Liverpool]CEL67159.1 TPA: synaptobrevin-like protein, putative [Neospora caninum Liverpool]|eukprot:XP_003883202.1 putative synaptobrevin-like protein [Neospora caninum Liverpool]
MKGATGTASPDPGFASTNVSLAGSAVSASGETKPPWNIGFVAVGNLKSKTVLDTFYSRLTSREKSALAPLFPRVLQTAPDAAPGLRRKFSVDDGGNMFLASDPTGAFLFGLYVHDKKYAERLAFALLAEVQQLVSEAVRDQPACGIKAGLLEKRLRQAVKGLISRFEQPESVDKTTEVLKKVEDVKIEMEKNVQMVLQNHANLESLESKTGQLAESAKTFKETAGDVKQAMRWQKIKLTVMLCIVIAATFGYLIYVVVDLISNSEK